ncbi:hypothetical protein OFM99_01025, partial [Acinetobacter baumannii]|nr:hypothetical protein [Acinetobacter baumannii]
VLRLKELYQFCIALLRNLIFYLKAIYVTSKTCNLFIFFKGYTLKALPYKTVTSVTFVTSKI